MDQPEKPVICIAPDGRIKPVICIAPDGRIFWRGREVETDADFRAAMLEVVKVLTKGNT